MKHTAADERRLENTLAALRRKPNVRDALVGLLKCVEAKNGVTKDGHLVWIGDAIVYAKEALAEDGE